MGVRKLSIIIPVYNSGKYLRTCIESVLYQYYEDVDVLLIDNGSTDNSRSICEEYEKKDMRVHVLNESKPGAAAARNCGIAHAKGEYISFVDSDDYVDKNMYCELIDLMEQHGADIACSSFNYVYENGSSTGWSEPELEQYIIKGSAIDSIECARYFLTSTDVEGFCWNKVFRKSIINELIFDESKKAYEDMLFVFKGILNSKKVVFCNKKLYYYRQISNSLTKDISEVRAEEFFDTIEKVANVACSYDLKDEADNYRAVRTIYHNYNQLKCGKVYLHKLLPSDISLFRAISLIIRNQRTEKTKTLAKLLYCLMYLKR